MAKLKGHLKLQGSSATMTFAETQDGIIMRERKGVSAERIATDPAYERTRQHLREFTRAGKAALLLLAAFRPYVHKAKDNRVFTRLTALMMQVIKGDTTNARGDRNVIDGNNQLIKGFELNRNAKLNTMLFAPKTTSFDRETAEMKVVFPPYIPGDCVSMPEGATHFRIVAAAVEVDFATVDDEPIAGDMAASNYLLPNNTLTTELTLTCTLTPDSVKPMFLVLGIQFFELVNGTQYAVNNEQYNAFKIVKMDM